MGSQANTENDGKAASLWWLLWAGVALFCFAAAVYFSGRERQYVNETLRLRQQLESATAQLSEWREASAILNADPGAMTLSTHPNGVSVGVISSSKRGVLLFASHLPPVPAGKAFELWIERPGQAPAAAGVFRPKADGSAIHVERNASATGASGFMITIESEAGAPQPTGEAVFNAPIARSAGH